MTNLNSVRTARLAFLIASFTPGKDPLRGGNLSDGVEGGEIGVDGGDFPGPLLKLPQEQGAFFALLAEILRLLRRQLPLRLLERLQGLDVQLDLFQGFLRFPPRRFKLDEPLLAPRVVSRPRAASPSPPPTPGSSS